MGDHQGPSFSSQEEPSTVAQEHRTPEPVKDYQHFRKMKNPGIMTNRLIHNLLARCIIWKFLLFFIAITQVTGNVRRNNNNDHSRIAGDVIFPGQLPRVQRTKIPTLSQCGKTSAKFGIGNNVKVQTIKPGDFPWLAAIGRVIQKSHFEAVCGGTLITHRHVLSVAHCWQDPRVINEPTHVRLGEHHLARDEVGEQDYKIVDKRMNNYNRDTRSNDIILLKLDRYVEFRGRIAPACLPFTLPQEEYHNKRLTVVGWGKTTKSAKLSLEPMREEPEHVPLGECQQKYKLQTIADTNICAGRGKADSCMGDSGGPLNFRSNQGRNAGHVFVVGIVSFGPINCGSSTKPGVYTNVAKYEQWIKSNLD